MLLGFAFFVLFEVKALEALKSAFVSRRGLSVAKEKAKAKRLYKRLNLYSVLKGTDVSKRGWLEVFFSVKTHKIDAPFRAIVSENGTWQKSIALFLQKSLNLLPIDDPFVVKNSDSVIGYLRSSSNLGAFSIDIKDLFYSLPQSSLLSCVQNCIDWFGSVAFMDGTGTSSGGFLELLQFYLLSTFIQWGDQAYIQKEGICIGSCIAPILSDLFSAEQDRNLSGRLHDFSITKTFR